jgi:hypothetical protein
VSNRRLKDAGFEATRSIDDGIKELLKGYRMLGLQFRTFESRAAGNREWRIYRTLRPQSWQAGQGTRLQSVLADSPKVLAPVRGRPFLSYLLDQLAEAGVQRSSCAGCMAEQVREAFGDQHRSLRLFYSGKMYRWVRRRLAPRIVLSNQNPYW